MCQTVPKIDIHVHLSNAARGLDRLPDGNFCTPAQLLEMYRGLGVERGVILPMVNPECAYTMQTNEQAMEIAGSDPAHFSWFCNVDPRMGGNSPDTDLSYFMEHYKALGAKGVGEVTANYPFDHPPMKNLFYHAQRCGLPLTFHIAPQQYGCYGIVDDLGLPKLERTLEAYPRLRFLGHSQPFWAEISADVTRESRNGYPTGRVVPGRLVELLRRYPNLCCDLSAGSGYNAVTRDPDFGLAFLEEFQDRLYFGTDICDPRNDMKLSHWLDGQMLAGRLSERAYRRISRENAAALLGL